MSDYRYDRKALRGLGTRDFMNQVNVRQIHIENASSDLPACEYNPNRLAAELHPDFLLGRIREAHKLPMAITYVIEPFREGGFTGFPPFKAGQYIPVEINAGGKYFNRSYSLCGSPRAVTGSPDDTYVITVGDRGPGHVSAYIHENWKPGTVVCFGAPAGRAYYEPLRDAKHVMVIGIPGTGLSMALAVAEGAEDFALTVLNIAPTRKQLAARERFEALVTKSRGRIRYVPVLTQEAAEHCDSGPVDSSLIKKYIIDENGEFIDTTIFIVAPNTMADPIEQAALGLGLPRRRIRKELNGDYEGACREPGYPAEHLGQTCRLRVWVRGEYHDIDCPAEMSLLRAMEEAGLHISSDCHTGECGWCHSRLIEGEYYMPASRDGRREADRKFGWIHPCCTYPLSDMELEIFPVH